MNIKAFSMTFGIAACLLAQLAVTGPFEDGLVAYYTGDYANAMQVLRNEWSCHWRQSTTA